MAPAAGAAAAERLDAIKGRGFLTCGVGANVPGFSTRDARGAWHGFDVDICKAIAAGIFGDATKLRFKPIDTLANFAADREIDLVLRGLTWTSGREVSGGLRFGPIILYDGQGFLVPKKLNIASPDALSGKSICISTDAGFTDFRRGLQVYFDNRKLVLKPVVKDRRANAADAFFAGECDAMSADASELAEAVIEKAPHPEDYVILTQQITKEPLAPLLRKGDDQFFDAVRWAIFALIDAEELGVTERQSRAHARQQRSRSQIFLRRGAPRHAGSQSGLDHRHREGRRQLRRNLRPQSGRGEQSETAARLKPAVDARRAALRAADSVKPPNPPDVRANGQSVVSVAPRV